MFGTLRRLITGQRQIERIAALDEKVSKVGRAQRDQLAGYEARLAKLAKTVRGSATAESVHGLGRRVEDLQSSLVQLDRTVTEALERRRLLDDLAHEDRRFARRLESMVRRGEPIVVGPWTGEVGFELLYWIPFVRWVTQTYQIGADRVFVISRGGVTNWYAGLASGYADVFEYFSPDEFRAATEERKKQRREQRFDARVVERVIAAHKLGRPSLLHPGMMYRLFMPYWKEQAPITRVDRYTSPVGIDGRPSEVRKELPPSYVAARFYFSDCFPDTPSNRALVVSVLDSISRDQPVVLLNTPFAVDDHQDAAVAGGRMVSVDARHLVPEQNLAVQTAVIAGATMFVGTYGGYSYLAPFCGVPALALYSRRSFQSSHLDVAQRALDRFGGARLVPIDTSDLPLMRGALTGSLSPA